MQIAIGNFLGNSVTSSTPAEADYDLLTSIELIIDASGMATSTNNTYGEVNGSNVIVTAKSLSPGPTGRDFTVNGSGVTFDPVTKSIAFNGSGRLRSSGAASLFNFMSFHASGYSSIKWTAFIVCKIGNTIKPSNVNYGLLGNNAGTSANRGVAISYGNTATLEDMIACISTRGTAGQFLGRINMVGAAPSNQYCVIAFRFDGAAATSQRLRLFVNNQAITFAEQGNNNTNAATNPAFVLEIGDVGNAVFPITGNIKEVVITSSTTDLAEILSFSSSLMAKHGIVQPKLVTQTYYADIDSTYKLSGVLGKNPTNSSVWFSAYAQGSQHVYDAGKKIVGSISSNSGTSWGSKFDIYNPAGNDAVQDIGGGFDANGVMHLFADVMNGSGAGTQVGARHIYSSNLSSWTNTDITSSLASDGLLAWRMYGNMIHVGGVWLKGYYKVTDQNSSAQSANYVFRSTDGINWTSVTVRAPGATHINESSVFWMGGDNIGYLVRNETTGEWSISTSTDLGLTWSAMQDITFGETITTPAPPVAKHFYLNGVLINVAYLTNRNTDTLYAVYGKASDIAADPVNGWNLNTKIMLFKSPFVTANFQYGDVVHYDDSLEALSLYAYDTYPPTGGTQNNMWYSIMPTWHQDKIISELGL